MIWGEFKTSEARSMSLLGINLSSLIGGFMRKRLAGLGFGLLFVVGLLYGQVAMACTTQTLIVGGKMTVCTVCGTVVSCM
jgi:hypothetical protein